MSKRIIVVGSGFTGLATAFYLKRNGWQVEVYDKNSRPGGLLMSEVTPWGLCESAANGLINTARVEELFRELGLEQLPTKRESRKRYIYRQGLLRWPLSFFEAHQLLLDLIPRFIFWRRSLKPHPLETLARWGERTMGAAATQYLLSPIFLGIYAGNSTRLSASLVLRRFFEKRERGRRPRIRGTVAPIKGMGHLAEQMAFYLQKEGVQFHFNTAFDWKMVKKAATPVVLCTSASAAAKLLRDKAPQLSRSLEQVEMLPLLSATVFYEKTPQDVDGFGVLFPRSEGFDVLGVLFNEQIFPERGSYRSENWIFGGAQKLNVCEWSDEYVLSKIKVERMKIFNSSHDPIGYRIYRWPEALPHYTTELETALEKLTRPPGPIFLAGNYLGRIGLSQILDDAYLFAERMNELEKTVDEPEPSRKESKASARTLT